MSNGPGASTGITLTYLQLVQQRDLDAAKAMLVSHPVFTYPGSVTYNDLDSCVAGRARFLNVRKRVLVAEETSRDDGAVTVYISGVLQGSTTDGADVDGVRFLDRLVIRDGLVERHEVWNDLGS